MLSTRTWLPLTLGFLASPLLTGPLLSSPRPSHDPLQQVAGVSDRETHAKLGDLLPAGASLSTVRFVSFPTTDPRGTESPFDRLDRAQTPPTLAMGILAVGTLQDWNPTQLLLPFPTVPPPTSPSIIAQVPASILPDDRLLSALVAETNCPYRSPSLCGNAKKLA
ncbi:MAG: hypothetical protein VKJ85_11135 [Prochlorothrix sp.]|nr:hypothetical protein [Prochlorothrix sp.]